MDRSKRARRTRTAKQNPAPSSLGMRIFRYTEMQNIREKSAMQENLVVSARGQITLPAALRKRFGIRPGDVVIMQDRDGEIVLKPAAVLEIDTYTDEQIGQWDEQDRLAPEERQAILQRLGVEK